MALRKRDGVLADTETALLWRAAEAIEWPMGPIVQLPLLTACRREEIGALRWDELHGDEIRLEGPRTKNGNPHHIPLSPQAKAITKAVPRIVDCPLVFSINGK